MARRPIAVLAAAVLAALVATAGSQADARPIIVFRAESLSFAQPVPLVVVLHGAGGTPRDMEKLTGFNRLAFQTGFVVAYLKSAGSGWNSIARSPTDDLDYISSEIDQLVVTENIDPTRVFVVGFSSGAYMAYRVACALSAKVAAIGDVAGGMATSDLPLCQPAHHVSVMSIHGNADTTVPIAGGGLLAPIASTLAHWTTIDGCGGRTRSEVGVLATQTWSCANGSAVTYFVLHGEPHDWPTQIPTTSLLWSFFAAHPAQAPSSP